MKVIFIVRILLISSFMSLCSAQEIKTGSPEFVRILHDGALAQFTLRVVDDEGAAVANANVQVSFAMENSKWIMGRSDTNGVFAATGQSRGDMLYDVTKDGYYRTADQLKFGRHDGVVVKDGKWQPWDPEIRVVLRPVKNPIPMYARIVETKIPTTNEMFGFDLVKGDWVQPVGEGIVADFVFSIKGFWRNYRDNDSMLELRFSNQADGAVSIDDSEITASSVLVLPRYAHEAGYQNALTWRRARSMLANESNDEIIDDLRGRGNYFFRIRSETNDMGVVTNAYYGKIRGNVEFVGAADKGNGSWLKFTYYLNPTPNDRNIEFDPKKNLFKNLKSTEEVSAP